MVRIIEIAAMIFKRVSVEEILEVWDSPNKGIYEFSCESFRYLANRTMMELTNDELSNLFERMKLQIAEEKRFLAYNSNKYNSLNGISPFDLLLIIANYFLEERCGTPVCKYENLLLWRNASLELDEDLFIAAFFAYKDIIRSVHKRNFCWKPVISHNNYVLQTVIDRGIAENHFHLNGSAQTFQLSWITLMNNPSNVKLKRVLDDIDLNRLNHEHIKFGYRNESLYTRAYRAAVIRFCLFIHIESQLPSNKDGFMEEICNNNADWNIYSIRDMFKYNEDTMCFNYADLQSRIEALCFYYQDRNMQDYAMIPVRNQDTINEYYSGERRLIYELIKSIYDQSPDSALIAYLLHIYIILKESVRSEIILNNDVKGFDNFRQYNNRKSSLILNKEGEKIFYRTAIIDTLFNQYSINTLEVRISPASYAKKIYEYIDVIDKSIKESIKEMSDGEKVAWELENTDNIIDESGINEAAKEKYRQIYTGHNYFYTLHFIKEHEKISNLQADDLCRHNDLRNKIKKQAFAIMKFREDYPDTSKRVYGIDAASSEIGCRPEVFAHAFRVLREHEVDRFATDSASPQRLRVTYHVGEDYIDILDGLRAIDEAIRFLNLSCGDRLGHALVLGVDIAEWYSMKNWVVNISQHDYLDNIAWLYSKIINYKLNVDHSIMFYLENEFHKYFRIVYGDNISKRYTEHVSEISEYLYDRANTDINISTYYYAWELRGDDPEDYVNGFYKSRIYTDVWEWNSVNRKYPKDITIRNSAAVAFLYYTYHYNSNVKLEGEKKIKVNIPKNLIPVIELVQKELRHIIAYKGICIETNPSSNCLIGPFGRFSYEKHPIIKFYNCGLMEKNEKQVENCSNIAVCINTDDQSIFKTSLENEYALMVRALESAKDVDGTHKYSRTSIYEWIDNIRRMGLDFSFGKTL
ncbi:MAG: hypothetical protein ACI4DP_02400 [Candidatus Ornithomonoglobus sp.]